MIAPGDVRGSIGADARPLAFGMGSAAADVAFAKLHQRVAREFCANFFDQGAAGRLVQIPDSQTFVVLALATPAERLDRDLGAATLVLGEQVGQSLVGLAIGTGPDTDERPR